MRYVTASHCNTKDQTGVVLAATWVDISFSIYMRATRIFYFDQLPDLRDSTLWRQATTTMSLSTSQP
jgi:hypothetical protein